jgi:hypothetical protein
VPAIINTLSAAYIQIFIGAEIVVVPLAAVAAWLGMLGYVLRRKDKGLKVIDPMKSVYNIIKKEDKKQWKNNKDKERCLSVTTLRG